MASNLDGPYKLRFGPDGALYVAEAGKGGDPTTAPCETTQNEDGSTDTTCFGATGAITKINGGQQSRVVTGLPSMASSSEVIGPVDVQVAPDGSIFTVIGFGGDPTTRADHLGGNGTKFGTIMKAAPGASTAPMTLMRLSPEPRTPAMGATPIRSASCGCRMARSASLTPGAMTS